ncbi:MAG TPA: hypothetical protein VME17_11825 [Bryobacteraceae bacterium]|nr:hypothetical protein [Bryobacteraceae bacterium]
MKAALLLAIAPFILYGQFGGPFPGGQYPGQYPSGRFPGGGGRRGSDRNTQSKPATSESDTYRGVVRKLDGASMDLEIEDTRFLIIDLAAVASKPADLRTGDGVDVTASQDSDGMFHASSIQFDRDIAKTINANDAIPGVQQEEGRTAPPPTILVRPDASTADNGDGPPVLKYGKQAQRPSDPLPDDAPNTASSTASLSRRADPRPTGDPHMALVEKARGVAASFLQGLPNYIVSEDTTRYVSETRQPSWNVVDLVSAEVVFEDNHETYRNLKINGRPSNKPPEESGAWSTGEFGTILGSLFSPYTDAEFKFAQDDTIEHRSAAIFDFKVLRVRSNWRIWTPGQYILPAYKGSVWIDKSTGEVLRLEMQAKDIPEKFPEITVETAVDYDSIRLGTPDPFLLPIDAQALSCWRDSNECQKNSIEFRNYHKFAGESNIEFK